MDLARCLGRRCLWNQRTQGASAAAPCNWPGYFGAATGAKGRAGTVASRRRRRTGSAGPKHLAQNRILEAYLGLVPFRLSGMSRYCRAETALTCWPMALDDQEAAWWHNPVRTPNARCGAARLRSAARHAAQQRKRLRCAGQHPQPRCSAARSAREQWRRTARYLLRQQFKTANA